MCFILKKYLKITAALLLLAVLSLPVLPSSASAGPKVFLDGKPLVFDVQPVIEKGRTLAPLRVVFEAMGARVEYRPNTGTVVAVKDATIISLTVGSARAKIDDQAVTLDVPARIINGRTMVPLRFISEALGAAVEWDGAAQEIRITSPFPQLASLNQPAEAREIVSRQYRWRYNDLEWTMDLNFSKHYYEYFKGLKRPQTSDYSVYVTNPYDDDYISELIRVFKDVQGEYRLTERGLVDFVVSFVQSLPYVPDDVSTGFDEYPKYPLETLFENGGDCEDTSILLAKILKGLDYGIVLLELSDHMAVGVKRGDNLPGSYFEYGGDRYYYVETTGEGWEIGEIPDEYKADSAVILPLVPKPVVHHTWKSFENDGPKLKVRVSNEGTGTAYNSYVYIAFDAGGGMVYNPKKSDLCDIPPQNWLEVLFNLDYPDNVHTRLIVRIISDGALVSESHSDWFDT